MGQQQCLALGGAEARQRVERRLRVLVQALVAMPDPGRVPTLGQAPGIRSDPGPRILELRDLAPLVPGAHEGVTDRAPGRREVAGERKGLQQQAGRSEEHTSELQSLMRLSYAVFCWKKQTT